MNQNLLAEDEDNNTTSSIILLGSLLLTMLKYGAFNVSLNHTFGTLERTFGTDFWNGLLERATST